MDDLTARFARELAEHQPTAEGRTITCTCGASWSRSFKLLTMESVRAAFADHQAQLVRTVLGEAVRSRAWRTRDGEIVEVPPDGMCRRVERYETTSPWVDVGHG